MGRTFSTQNPDPVARNPKPAISCVVMSRNLHGHFGMRPTLHWLQRGVPSLDVYRTLRDLRRLVGSLTTGVRKRCIGLVGLLEFYALWVEGASGTLYGRCKPKEPPGPSVVVALKYNDTLMFRF